MSLAELERSLEQGLLPTYLLIGDASPLVERALQRVLDAALPAVGLPAFNHGTYRATEGDPAAAFAAARTLPMMAGRRLVVVREIHEGNDVFFQHLTEYLQDPPATTTLVLVGAGFPKVEKGGSNWGARVKNALKGHGLLLTFEASSVSPARFAVEHAARLGKELSRADAELLVELTGPDLARLTQEVEKLSLYVGVGARIDSVAIGAATTMLAEAVIWDLTAGLATRNTGQALGALHRLQEGGDDPRRLLAMIVWQYRELLKVAELVRAGTPDGEIHRAVRVRPEVVRAVRDQIARGFPGSAEVLRRLATAHREMNSHRAGDQRILEGLVLEMLTA